MMDGEEKMMRRMFERGRYDGIVVEGFGEGNVQGEEEEIIERYE